jgi:hypothetical protein
MTTNEQLLREILEVKTAVARVEERLTHLEKPSNVGSNLVSGGSGGAILLLCQYLLQQTGLLR